MPGEKGDQGSIGDDGAIGQTGPQGEPGPQGEKGDPVSMKKCCGGTFVAMMATVNLPTIIIL